MLIGNLQFVFWPKWHWGWMDMPKPLRSVYADHVFWVGPLEIRRFR